MVRFLSITILSVFAWSAATAQVNVLTYRYDNARTGANLNETILNPTSVAGGFGKLYSRAVDGFIYAQPLYVSNVTVPGKGIHNVVYVATMNDVVYAFDADSNADGNSDPLWQVSLVNPALGITPVPATDVDAEGNIVGNIGIESTPVIDAASNTLYLVARTKENGSYFQRLHALDITTGAERPNSPVTIAGTVSSTAGTAIANKLAFDPKLQNQRAGLALANNQVLIAWASHEDYGPYHGWTMAYDKTSLAQKGIICTTPNGQEGGIWMSGWSPAVDAGGYVYFVVGNGTWDGRRNFGESVWKVGTVERFAPVDFFTPYDWDQLNGNDDDLGSTGFMLIPGSTYGVAIGKKSKLYVLNTNRLGWTAPSDTEVPQILDLHSINPTVGESKGGPVYWNRPNNSGMLFIEAEADYIRGFPVTASAGITLDSTPAHLLSSAPYYAPQRGGGNLSISGDPAGQRAIVWSTTTVSDTAEVGVTSGVLRAFDASNGLVEIWDSEMNSERDGVGNWAKFVPPVVANGHLYLATFSNELHVYGLIQ